MSIKSISNSRYNKDTETTKPFPKTKSYRFHDRWDKNIISQRIILLTAARKIFTAKDEPELLKIRHAIVHAQITLRENKQKELLIRNSFLVFSRNFPSIKLYEEKGLLENDLLYQKTMQENLLTKTISDKELFNKIVKESHHGICAGSCIDFAQKLLSIGLSKKNLMQVASEFTKGATESAMINQYVFINKPLNFANISQVNKELVEKAYNYEQITKNQRQFFLTLIEVIDAYKSTPTNFSVRSWLELKNANNSNTYNPQVTKLIETIFIKCPSFTEASICLFLSNATHLLPDNTKYSIEENGQSLDVTHITIQWIASFLFDFRADIKATLPPSSLTANDPITKISNDCLSSMRTSSIDPPKFSVIALENRLAEYYYFDPDLLEVRDLIIGEPLVFGTDRLQSTFEILNSFFLNDYDIGIYNLNIQTADSAHAMLILKLDITEYYLWDPNLGLCQLRYPSMSVMLNNYLSTYEPSNNAILDRQEVTNYSIDIRPFYLIGGSK